MKRIMGIMLVIFMMIGVVEGVKAGDINALQLYYLVNQTFPEAQNVSVLISKNELPDEINKIKIASKQSNIKTEIYQVDNSVDIGQSIKKIAEKSILIIFESALLNQNKNKLYVLSKCKEKQISIVTSSKDLIESGALIGCFNAGGELNIILNLKHYEYLKSKFSDDLIQQVGINRVIS